MHVVVIGSDAGAQPGRVPTVLFVCEHNAGRLQLAAGLAAVRAAGRVGCCRPARIPMRWWMT